MATLSERTGGLPSAATACAVLVFAAAGLLLVQVDTDPDLWGRMAYARDAAAQGAVVLHRDIYSYTVPGHVWVDHEWGFNWVAWWAYRAGGWAAIRALRLVFLGLLGALCLSPLRFIRDAGVGLPMAALVLALPLSIGSVGPRAQVFTCLFLAWAFYCLLRADHGRPAWLVGAVAPMPAWINIHAGFLVGLGVLAIGGVHWLLARVNRERARWWVAGASLALASLFMTPWGPGYVLFALRSALLRRPFVPEWGPIDLSPFGLSWVLLAATWIPPLLRRPMDWRAWAFLLVFGVESALHRRHLPLFAIASAFLALPGCVRAWAEWRQALTPSPRGERWLSAGVLLAGAVLMAVTARVCCRPAPAEPDFPAKALAALQARGADHILVDFNWAQYVLFHRAPGTGVAIDGRYEEVYPPEVMDRYFAWHFGAPGWRSLLDAPEAHYALVASGSDRARRLDGLPGWERIYSDPVASAYVKSARRSAPSAVQTAH